MVIQWPNFEVFFIYIWIEFDYTSVFPERFSHFTLPYFPGTGAAEQLDSAGCSSWWFPKCCEQGMPGLLFLNIHSMSAACVKVFAPLSLKTTKLFNTHIYKTCSRSNLGLLALIWRSCHGTPLRWISFSLPLLHRPSRLPCILSKAETPFSTCHFGSSVIKPSPSWHGFQLGGIQFYLRAARRNSRQNNVQGVRLKKICLQCCH